MLHYLTITRRRKDAVLFEIPPQPGNRGRGRPRVYGDRIDVKGMAESEHGWQYVVCRQYGQMTGKRTKTFVAAGKLTRGKPVKVVLVKEDDKTWLPLVSTDVALSTKEILEMNGTVVKKTVNSIRTPIDAAC